MRRSSRLPPRTTILSPWRRVAVVALALGLAPSPAGAQVPQEVPDSTAPMAQRVSPRGAMIRAMLLPGWGHASIGSYNRGAFYFAAEGISFWMLSRSVGRLEEARGRIALRDRTLRMELEAEGVTDPLEILDRIDVDEAMVELLGLEEARRRQREDWLALGIFLMLISGVDAYVSAHLQDFPDPLEIEARPVGEGRIEVGARLRLPN